MAVWCGKAFDSPTHVFLLEAFRFVLIGQATTWLSSAPQFLRARLGLRRFDLGNCPWELVHGLIPSARLSVPYARLGPLLAHAHPRTAARRLPASAPTPHGCPPPLRESAWLLTSAYPFHALRVSPLFGLGSAELNQTYLQHFRPTYAMEHVLLAADPVALHICAHPHTAKIGFVAARFMLPEPATCLRKHDKLQRRRCVCTNTHHWHELGSPSSERCDAPRIRLLNLAIGSAFPPLTLKLMPRYTDRFKKRMGSFSRFSSS
ncbi:hypothetical protein BC827DRAFT_1263431 [Russula dissimulans]|nr:hypothetical protein BC827DRAFT_1263431 [Russula dissimulans]